MAGWGHRHDTQVPSVGRLRSSRDKDAPVGGRGADGYFRGGPLNDCGMIRPDQFKRRFLPLDAVPCTARQPPAFRKTPPKTGRR